MAHRTPEQERADALKLARHYREMANNPATLVKDQKTEEFRRATSADRRKWCEQAKELEQFARGNG